jgi:hypothetical protein
MGIHEFAIIEAYCIHTAYTLDWLNKENFTLNKRFLPLRKAELSKHGSGSVN